MENTVQWTNRATRQLAKIDRRYISVIEEKVKMLKNFPNVAIDVKHLENDMYRFRHGDYRIFFEWIEDNQPKIIKIQKVMRRQSKTYS